MAYARGEKLHGWYKTVNRCTIREVKSARNASAESLNSKMKAFRAQLRGVSDLPFFMSTPPAPATPLTPCGRGQYLLYHVNVPCSKSHKKTAIRNFLNRVFNPASISTKSVLLYFCNRSNFTDFFTPSLRIHFTQLIFTYICKL